MLNQNIGPEQGIYGVTVDALINFNTKVQFKVNMEVIVYIQEIIEWK